MEFFSFLQITHSCRWNYPFIKMLFFKELSIDEDGILSRDIHPCRCSMFQLFNHENGILFQRLYHSWWWNSFWDSYSIMKFFFKELFIHGDEIPCDELSIHANGILFVCFFTESYAFMKMKFHSFHFICLFTSSQTLVGQVILKKCNTQYELPCEDGQIDINSLRAGTILIIKDNHEASAF